METTIMAAMPTAIFNAAPAFCARSGNTPIRVLTVDEHQLVQEGLASIINGERDMAVVARASSGREAIDCFRRTRPNVVTLDLLLPDMPGEEVARRILTESPRTRMVAITAAQGYTLARLALDAGVQGYVS